MREGKAGRLKSFRKAKQPKTRSQKAKAQTDDCCANCSEGVSVCGSGERQRVQFAPTFPVCAPAFFSLKHKLKWLQTRNKCFTPGLCVNIDVCIKWIIVMWSTVTTFCSPWARVGIWHCDARIMLLGSRRSLFKFTNTAECVLLKWVLACVSENTHIYTRHIVHVHVCIMFVYKCMYLHMCIIECVKKVDAHAQTHVDIVRCV